MEAEAEAVDGRLEEAEAEAKEKLTAVASLPRGSNNYPVMLNSSCYFKLNFSLFYFNLVHGQQINNKVSEIHWKSSSYFKFGQLTANLTIHISEILLWTTVEIM